MSFEISKLGLRYDSLGAAAVDKSPSELVISDEKEESFYIVSPEIYQDGPQQQGFKIMVNEGE